MAWMWGGVLVVIGGFWWVLIGSDEFWWGVFFEGLPTKTHQPLLQPVILSKAKDLWDSTTLITTREILHCVQNDKRNPQESTRTQKNSHETHKRD